MPMRAPDFWHEPPGVAAALLTPASAAWEAAAWLRRVVARPYRAPVPVICVGNLVAGGSGKTPVVMSLAGMLASRAIAVHVVTSGYGGALAGPVRVDPARHDAAAVGDDPGPAELHDAVCPVLRAVLEAQNGDGFAGTRLVAFAGIGHPAKFFAALRRLGAELVMAQPFADHHRYREAEVARLRERAVREDARLVTTAKDWVRLPPSWRAGIEVIEVEIRWQDSAALDRLLSRFHDRRDRRAAGD